MRTALLCVSACAACFFAVSLALTFLAQPYITGLARDFVIERTQRLTEPAVEIGEQALRAPGLKRVLDNETIEVARQELADYRGDPRGYIARLVRDAPPAVPALASGAGASLKERLLHWKGRLRAHFARTFARLVLDLRIFAGANLVVALLAAWAALRSGPGQETWLLGVAGLLLVSVAYGTMLYVDGLTYFRILFGIYIGWWYPVVLGSTFIGLYLEYGRRPRSGRVIQ